MARALKSPFMMAYDAVVEPVLARLRRKSRLAAFRETAETDPPLIVLHPQGRANDLCRWEAGISRRVLSRYLCKACGDGASNDARLRPAVLTPMVIDLARFERLETFEAHIRQRSSRTLPKVRRALRLGYDAHRFPLRRHVLDVHAVKTSMRMRAGGPVLDYWLLRPRDIAPQATKTIRLKPPPCAEHWALWWGAFAAEPGHLQGGVSVDERLVAYVKLTRIGDLLHYTDIMGHADHLDAGVMWLLHLAIMRWLIESGDPLVAGLRVVLYGAAEHGGEGLLVWKKRAGFAPARLVAAADGREIGDMLSSRGVAR